jgi:hypothetical protein
MTRTIAFVLVLALSTATVAPAEAQAPSFSLSREDELELRTIESNARTATGLYIAGVVTHVVGAGLVAGGAGWSWSQLCISWGAGSCPPRDDTGPTLMLVAGSALFLGGLVTIFTGIGFDADSGRRRRALHERNPSFEFSLAPTEDGAYGSVTLAF